MPLIKNATARLHSISEMAPEVVNWHGGDTWVVSICSVGNAYITKTGKTPLQALQRTWDAFQQTPLDQLLGLAPQKKTLTLDDLGL